MNVRREELDARFVELLESLRPKAEFMALIREIVLDVWNERRAGAASLRTAIEGRLAGLRRKESALDDAYLYDERRRIDATTYERQRDKLGE